MELSELEKGDEVSLTYESSKSGASDQERTLVVEMVKTSSIVFYDKNDEANGYEVFHDTILEGKVKSINRKGGTVSETGVGHLKDFEVLE